MATSMKHTYWSLYYLLAYLTFGGVGLLAAPHWALRLLASNGDYGDVMPRTVGMMMCGLAIIVANVIRLRLEAFYPVTLMVRGFFAPCLVALYFYSRDPFFLVIFGIMGLGMVFTGTSYLLDRRKKDEAPAAAMGRPAEGGNAATGT